MKLQNLAVLLSTLLLLSCSDSHSAPWDLTEFEFDWRLDWPISIYTDAVHGCYPGDDCDTSGTVSVALGDLCYYHFYDICHTTHVRASIERLEAMGVDYSVSYRLASQLEDNVSIPPQWPEDRTLITDRCYENPCPDGESCEFSTGTCHPEGQTACSRICVRISACYEGVDQCEQKCEIMLDGPCADGACPLSEFGISEYLSGLERLSCEVIKEWDALRLFPEMSSPNSVRLWAADDCSPLQEAAIEQRKGFLIAVSTAEAAESANECEEFGDSCVEQLNCLKERGLIDDDI